MPSRAALRRARRSAKSDGAGDIAGDIKITSDGDHQKADLTSDHQVAFEVGRVDSFGGCSLHVFHKAVTMISWYDRCCLASTSSAMANHITKLGVGIPGDVAPIQADPPAFCTPALQQFLSILLEFHLPFTCPHSAVLWQNADGDVSLACPACGGMMCYSSRVLPYFMRLASRTSATDQQMLRACCLQLVREVAMPKIKTVRLAINEHTHKLVLKPEHQKEEQLKAVASSATFTRRLTCTCETCQRAGDGPSGDECGPRAGRRKGRRGTKPRQMAHLWMDNCQNDACQRH